MKRIFTLFFLFLTFQSHAFEAAVVSANPAATRVGIEVIKNGGNAADAAIAVAMALSVVEPYNSGLGGGGFLLYYDAKKKEFSFLDYRETAPWGASPGIKNKKFYKEGIGSVAVPGFVRGMEAIHKKWAKKEWGELLQPALNLAKEGIKIKGKLSQKISENLSSLKADPSLADIFASPFESHAEKIRQIDLAKTLDLLKKKGADIFYRGEVAQNISRWIKKKGGLVSSNDLSRYTVYWRKPHQFINGPHQITTAPIPSSGGMGIALLFNKAIINRVDEQIPYSPEAYRLLLNGIKDYFDYRDSALGDSNYNVVGHTTHISIIDSEGNMASMTNTLNSPFGSALVVPGTGIILNDEMNDFSFHEGSPNRIAGGRRPLSSMTPIIIFKNLKPHMILGTPGGLTIPQNLFFVLYQHWQWQATLDRAIGHPKFYYSPISKKIVAEEYFSPGVLDALKSEYEVELKPTIGNIQALVVQSPTNTKTYSDPRGEGNGLTFLPKNHP